MLSGGKSGGIGVRGIDVQSFERRRHAAKAAAVRWRGGRARLTTRHVVRRRNGWRVNQLYCVAIQPVCNYC